jgi:hypothetical protein
VAKIISDLLFIDVRHLATNSLKEFLMSYADGDSFFFLDEKGTKKSRLV